MSTSSVSALYSLLQRAILNKIRWAILKAGKENFTGKNVRNRSIDDTMPVPKKYLQFDLPLST